MILYIDCETYSEVPLNRGLVNYARRAEVMVVTWAVDDGPVHCWDVTTYKIPDELKQAALGCTRAVAHNVSFDRTIFRHAMPRLAKALEGKWYCTLGAAYRHGLPGGLDKLCQVFRVASDSAKINGRELILLFCKPNKKGERNTRFTHPQRWQEFLQYARSDISAMREVYKRLPKWNDTPEELALWLLDQKINDRGIGVDVEFAQAAVRATAAERKRLSEKTQELTDGVVLHTTQRDRLLRFIFVEHGIDLPDLKADTVERRLNDPELPESMRELLCVRQQASLSSTSKYRRVLDLQADGRLYNTLQYRGAYRTGRWAGRDFQPQNLPRPTMKFPAILQAIEDVKAGVEEFAVDNIMEAMSSACRSVLVPAQGCKFVVADLANIEGRKLAWLAGESWKLNAFAAFDAGRGPDLYKVAYGRSFGVKAEDVPDDGDERQIGKVQELALGYQGGVGAFVAMAAVYHMDLDAMARKVQATVPTIVWQDAISTYQWAKANNRTLGLPEHVYAACEALKRLWRNAHPQIVAFWSALEDGCRGAILSPGTVFTAGRIQIDRQGAWLRLRLPSGRFLCYPGPRIGPEGAIEFLAWDVYRKALRYFGTYGGMLSENVTQAASCDVMAHGMMLAENAGYPIVLTVHDELVTEPLDEPDFSPAGLSALLATVPKWAKGLPLAAKGFEGYRYRKG